MIGAAVSDLPCDDRPGERREVRAGAPHSRHQCPVAESREAGENTCLGCAADDFRWIWLIGIRLVDSVIQITVLAGILAHCPGWEGRGKMAEVLGLGSMGWNTSKYSTIHVDSAVLLVNSAMNTFPMDKSTI